jgi:hypothetical protein
MIRLVGLGVAAVVALGALHKRKHHENMESHRELRQEPQNPVVAKAHADTWASAVEAKPAAPAPPALKATRPYAEWAQLLLRLAISLLATALLHMALGRSTPWSSLILTTLALFVLTEHMQKVGEWVAAMGNIVPHCCFFRSRAQQSDRSGS